jgi:hypothetical protein
VRRFPYIVLYRIERANNIVIGCFHGSRNPQSWQGRR